MKHFTLGYICNERGVGKDEEIFTELAKQKNIELIMFNTAKEIDEKELEEKAQRCDLIFNNCGDEFVYEIIKTFEAIGKKVIEPSKIYYFTEDKWISYILFSQNKIPTPETSLLSTNLNIAKKDLKLFNHWPVVLKRVWGCRGEYVEKADNMEQAEAIIKRFWEKGDEKLPIIAQEFIKSSSYRVTVIGDEIVQTAIKDSKGWKCTGVYEKKVEKFNIDPELEKIIKKVMRTVKIKVCGIDFLKKEDKWLVLEVNSVPAYDFFEDERKMLIGKILDYLKTQVRK